MMGYVFTSMLGQNGTRPPKGWRKKFLKALESTPVIRMACRAACVSQTLAYNERNSDAQFKEQWDDALMLALGKLDKKHFELALNGVRKSIWKNDNGTPVKVETITEYNPQMMQWILSRLDPKYKEVTRLEHGGIAGGPPVQIQQLPPLVSKELEDDV